MFGIERRGRERRAQQPTLPAIAFLLSGSPSGYQKIL